MQALLAEPDDDRERLRARDPPAVTELELVLDLEHVAADIRIDPDRLRRGLPFRGQIIPPAIAIEAPLIRLERAANHERLGAARVLREGRTVGKEAVRRGQS